MTFLRCFMFDSWPLNSRVPEKHIGAQIIFITLSAWLIDTYFRFTQNTSSSHLPCYLSHHIRQNIDINYTQMYSSFRASLMAQWVKNPPVMQKTQEMWVRSLDQEDPLQEGMGTHSSILAWRIPYRLRSMGSQRVHLTEHAQAQWYSSL